MIGDLPPNSSETTFKLLVAAACITIRPTSVDPVKFTYKIKRTILWLEPEDSLTHTKQRSGGDFFKRLT
jgi:hypothetical protein